MPLIERVSGELGAIVSVDTYKPAVARAAIAAGASIVNDVSGLRDPALADVCAETGAALVLMHTRAAPKQKLLDPGLDGRVVRRRRAVPARADRARDRARRRVRAADARPGPRLRQDAGADGRGAARARPSCTSSAARCCWPSRARTSSARSPAGAPRERLAGHAGRDRVTASTRARTCCASTTSRGRRLPRRASGARRARRRSIRSSARGRAALGAATERRPQQPAVGAGTLDSGARIAGRCLNATGAHRYTAKEVPHVRARPCRARREPARRPTRDRLGAVDRRLPPAAPRRLIDAILAQAGRASDAAPRPRTTNRRGPTAAEAEPTSEPSHRRRRRRAGDRRGQPAPTRPTRVSGRGGRAEPTERTRPPTERTARRRLAPTSRPARRTRPRRAPRKRRGDAERGGRAAPSAPATERATAEAPTPERRAQTRSSVEGVVELLPNGSGFVRVAPARALRRRRLHLRRAGQALRARLRRPGRGPAARAAPLGAVRLAGPDRHDQRPARRRAGRRRALRRPAGRVPGRALPARLRAIRRSRRSSG